MYHVGIDASPPPIRYRSIMNDTIDTYLIPDRRFSLCRYLADTVTAPSGPIPFGYRGASVSASVSAMADTRYQHICICRARCEQTAKLSIPPKSGNNKYQLSIERWFGIVSLARSGDGATRQRSVARSSPASPGSPSSASSASSPASPSLAEAAGLVQARSKPPPKRNLELQPVVPGRKGSSKRCKSGE
jgi:hypothetical protein